MRVVFVLVHRVFRGLLHVFPLGETFLSLIFMKRTIAHNSLTVVILHFFPWWDISNNDIF
jgi:hypothetical protein